MPGRSSRRCAAFESRNPVILLDELDKVGADFAATRLRVARSARSGAERLVHRPLPELPFDLSHVLSSPPRTGWSRALPRCATGWKSSNCPLHRDGKIANRLALSRAAPVGGTRPHRRATSKTPSAALCRLIREYAREAGMRLSNAKLPRSPQGHAQNHFRQRRGGDREARRKTIDGLSRPRAVVAESAEKITEIGIATGLAWTPVGGDILFIEATRMRGRGNFNNNS